MGGRWERRVCSAISPYMGVGANLLVVCKVNYDERVSHTQHLWYPVEIDEVT